MNQLIFDKPKTIEELKGQYNLSKVSLVTSANLYPLVKGIEYEGDASLTLMKKRVFPIKRKMDQAIEAYTNDMLKEWDAAKKKLLALKNRIKTFKKMDYNNVQTIDRIGKIPFRYKKQLVEIADKYDLNLAVLDKIVINPSLVVNARYDGRKNLLEFNEAYLAQHGMIRIGETKELISETTKTFVHEFGHCIWYNSLTEEDRRAWASLSRFYERADLTGDMNQYVVGEKKKFDGSVIYSPYYTNRNDVFISIYARFSMREDFAECFLYYKVSPETLQKIDANKYIFLEEKIGRKLTKSIEKYGTSEGADKAWDTRGRKGKETNTTVDWKPVMTKEEGYKWNENSKFRGKFYHGTDNAKKLLKDGFNDGGVFLTESSYDASHFGKDKIQVFVNVKNVLDIPWNEKTDRLYPDLPSRSHLMKDKDALSYHSGNGFVLWIKDKTKVAVVKDPETKEDWTGGKLRLYKSEGFEPTIQEPHKVRDKIIMTLEELKDNLNSTAKEHLSSIYNLGRQKGVYYTGAALLAAMSQEDKDKIQELLNRNDTYLDNFMDQLVDEYDDVLFDKTPTGMIEGEKTYSDIDEFDSKFSDVMDTKEHRLGLYAVNGLSLGLMAGMMAETGEEFAGGYWHTTDDDRVCDGCAKLDGMWMSYDEYNILYGNNECDGNCRCGELFEPAYAPGDDLQLMVKGGQGSGNFGHQGRPGEIGGSGGGTATQETNSRYSDKTTIDKEGKIHTSDVNDAVKALYEGRKVVLSQPREVSTLLDKLAQISREAEAAGKEAKMYDLCNVSVAGTNLFCAQSKGIPRLEMPQLKGQAFSGSPADQYYQKDKRGEVDITSTFVDQLKLENVKVIPGEERADYLRATQNELNGVKVAGITQAIREGKLDSQYLIISRDNYIIDGHHRWAATVAVDYEDNAPGDLKMPVMRVDMDIIPLLERTIKFTDDMGIKRQVAKMLKCACQGLVKGGTGSGNFNHAGRPGNVGGSGEGGSSGKESSGNKFLKGDRQAFVKELETERNKTFSPEHEREMSMFFGVDWIGQDQSGSILKLNQMVASHYGSKIEDRDIVDVFSKMRPGVNPAIGLIIMQTGFTGMTTDGKPVDRSNEMMTKILKEKEFSYNQFKKTFGDSVEVYKGITAKHSAIVIENKTAMVIKDMPLSSYTIDKNIAREFAGKDGHILSRTITAGDAWFGVHSHPDFSNKYGKHKNGEGEIVVGNKDPYTHFKAEKVEHIE